MNKAQGALEYLLLIGGAVLVAVVVITLILGLTSTAGTETETTVGSAFDVIREAREGGTGGGTPTTVTVTLLRFKHARSGSVCDETVGYFLTTTDYGSLNIDYGGVISFTLDDAIPAGATITSATLTMHQEHAFGNCKKVDPLYFYKNTSGTCTSAEYNVINDTGPPAGEDATSYPTPDTCGYNEDKTFEIPGAITKGETTIHIEIRGDDVHSKNIYRRWNNPRLDIVYTN